MDKYIYTKEFENFFDSRKLMKLVRKKYDQFAVLGRVNLFIIYLFYMLSPQSPSKIIVVNKMGC